MGAFERIHALGLGSPIPLTAAELTAITATFKHGRFLPAAHGLTAFAFALWDWKSAAQSSAGFAVSNSSLP
jgi:hypothetical protein